MNKLVKSLMVFICLAACSGAYAQIPNPGFETWSAGIPTGWTTDNVAGVDTVIVQTTDAHSGTYAAQGIAKSVASAVIAPNLYALMATTVRPTTFTGYYKYSPVSGDTLLIGVAFAKNSSAIAAGIIKTAASVTSYTQFSIPISFTSSVTPDSAAIVFQILPASGSSSAHAGSTFKVDDLSFSGTTGVSTIAIETPQSFTLSQNFPNPFNPTTTIDYQLPVDSRITLKVYDVMGREVRSLFEGNQSAGDHRVVFDGSGFASGVYLYRMTAIGANGETFRSMKKLVLLK